MYKKPTTTILLFLLLFSIHLAFSQNVKFGKASKQELEEKFYPLDSSANAVILYKKRRTHYDYSDNEGWVLMTKIHERIKIYNKEGYDWATKKISLYKGRDDEKVSIKAYTFNLINGKVEKIKLNSKEIFDEDVNKYWGRKKFTMPNLTEGSVIEWEYSIKSPYYWRIEDLVFQHKIPLKYIDVEIKIPEYFKFKYLPNYYYPVKVNEETKNRKLNFTYREEKTYGLGGDLTPKLQYASVDLQEKIYSSVEKNIPAIKEEPYVNNIDNYKSKVSFEITAYTPKYGTHEYYNTTWEDVTKTIYKSSNFGEQLKKTSYFKDDLNSIVDLSASVPEKIAKIFQFVKNKIKWNDFREKYTTDGVKKAYKDGVGNVAEINLILVSMLREAGLKANPILVSTRDHGIPFFPTSQGFNYVIAGVETDKNIILLDATEKYSIPNVLPLRALNWRGRIIRKDGSSSFIDLLPKKPSTEKTFLTATLDTDALLSGAYRVSYTDLPALNHRNMYNNINNDDLIGKLEKDNQNIEISELKVKNKDDIGKPLTYTVSFESDNQAEIIGDKMYFSPLLFLAEKENPFKLEGRKYPVDFGAPWTDKFNITINIPKGYSIESKPENASYALPDNLGFYIFMAVVKGDMLQIKSDLEIKTPIITSVHYKSLKEFYKLVIDKQLEKVVLSK